MKKNILLFALAAGFVLPVAEAQKIKTKAKSKPETLMVTPVMADAPRKTSVDFARTITAAGLSEHLHILASDAFEGRETGQKGQKMAAEYISAYFKKLGLAGPNAGPNPYFQQFDLEESRWKTAALQVGKKNFVFLQDFYLYGDEPTEKTQPLNLVFAGYGIETPAYSDYANLDVKNKTVVILAGEPVNAQGNYLVTSSKEPSPWSTDFRTKSRMATQKGAKNVIIVSDGPQGQFQAQLKKLRHRLESPTLNFSGKPGRTPVVFVTQEAGAALLNTTPKKLLTYRSQVDKAGKPVASRFKPAAAATLTAEKFSRPLSTENVLGYLEGTDKKDELLVITAHYDHIGKDTTKTGDQIYNGADDDGSGTSAVLELAHAFAEAKKAGYAPRRSILFMTVTAEEKGLLGSDYYTTNPVFPLQNTIANLNIDMIGRLDKAHANDKNYVYVIGSDKLSSELHQISEDANRKYSNLKLDYTYNDENDPNRFYYRSDHYNFAKNNIPVAFYFNGVHEDYHQESDEVEKILFDKMENITRLVFYTAWELANRDERIKVDSNKK